MPAHAELRSLTPANGATLTVPPTELVLAFNEDINPAFVQVTLTQAGAPVALAPPSVSLGTVTVPVPAGPEVGAGAYRIAYRVVSADGHPVSGASEFSVTAAPIAAATPTAVPATTPAAPATPVAAAGAGSSSGTPLLAVTGLVLVVAGATVLLWYRRRRLGHANRVQ